MTAPEPKFDAELAWDIQTWSEETGLHEDLRLNRALIRDLTRYLSSQGYHKGKPSGLGGLLSTLEETGAKLVDEFGPLIDGLRKPR